MVGSRLLLALAPFVIAASVNGQAGIVATEDNDLVLKPATDAGTIVFHDASSAGGTTSVRAILAQLGLAATDLDLEAVKTSVDGLSTTVDQKLVAQKAAVDGVIVEIKTSVENAATETDIKIAKVGDDLKKGMAEVTASITTEVKPQIEALKTEVGGKVDKVEEVVGDILKALLGSNAAMAADNCAAIKSVQPLASDDYFWIKNAGAVVKVFCKVVSGKFVSMGGDGSSKAAAAAGCNGNVLAANNVAETKWVDPDANAENTGNAVQKRCVLYTCKEIKDAEPGNTKSGTYTVKPKGWSGAPFEVWCDMTKDGGGWTLTEMHSEGYSNRPIGRSMPDKGANEDQLLSRGDDFGKYKGGNQGDFASLGEKKIMALYHSFGAATILRNWNEGKYFGNRNTGVNFYYQKKLPKKDWSIFHAIRNTKLWSGKTNSRRAWSSAKDGFKMTWKEGDNGFKTETTWFDPKANQIKKERGNGNSGTRGYMNYWEEHTITGNSGKNFRTSRHGIPGDPFSGCTWNFYFYGGNSRRSYGHCGRMKKSFYWLR